MNYLRGLVVLFALAASSAALADYQLYGGLGIGRSDADVSAADMTNRLNALGHNVTGATVDSEDGGWRFLMGLSFTDMLAVEFGYVDLGEVRTSVTADTPPADVARFTQDVANGIPVMPRGLTLAGVIRFPLGQNGMAANTNIALKLGIIDADSDREVNGASGIDETNGSAFYGVTFGYNFNETWRGVIGYEVFDFGDSVSYWSAGLEFTFPKQ